MKSKPISKILSYIISFALVVGTLPVTAFAEEGTAGDVSDATGGGGVVTYIDGTGDGGNDGLDTGDGDNLGSGDGGGTGAPGASVCVCEALCVEDSVNADCPVCGGDYERCAYTAAPVASPGDTGNEDGGGLKLAGDGESCVCEALCDAEAPNPECPVCVGDPLECFHYYCYCETACTGDSQNTDCPVCRDDYTKCAQTPPPTLAAATTATNALLSAINDGIGYGITASHDAATNTVTVSGTYLYTDGYDNNNTTLDVYTKTLVIPAGVTVIWNADYSVGVTYSSGDATAFSYTSSTNGFSLIEITTEEGIDGSAVFRMGTDGQINLTCSGYYATVLVRGSAKLEMQGGAITVSSSYGVPYALYIAEDADVEVTGGTVQSTVSGDLTGSACAIFVDSIGSSLPWLPVKVSGGTVRAIGNAGSGAKAIETFLGRPVEISGAGVVYALSTGNRTASGISSYNYFTSPTDKNGDPVVIVKDGSKVIAECTGGGFSEGIYAMSSGIYVSGGTVQASGNAGAAAIYTRDAKLLMDSGKIQVGDGTGIFADEKSTVTITGGTVEAGPGGKVICAVNGSVAAYLEDTCPADETYYSVPYDSTGMIVEVDRHPGNLELHGGTEGLTTRANSVPDSNNITENDIYTAVWDFRPAGIGVKNSHIRFTNNSGADIDLLWGIGIASPYDDPSGGGSSSSGGGSTTPAAPSAPVVAPIDNKALNTAINEAVNAAASTASNAGGNSLKVTLKNVSEFTKANADAIIKKAKELGIPAKVSSDVMSEDGKSVEVRITVDPALITQTVKLDGYVRESQVRATAAKFDKFFANKTTVVHLGQEGAFGQTARVAAKVDLAGFDSKNLYFYAYDKKTNSYKRIESPAYRIDSNGYLHFDTDFGGEIIISENPLERK